MKASEWKDMFVKNNIPRDIDTASRDVKTFITLMECTIAKKDALFGTKLKFVFIEWTQIGPDGTAKNSKKGVVGFDPKEMF